MVPLLVTAMATLLTHGARGIAHIESKAGKEVFVIEGQTVPLPFRLDDFSIDIGNGLAISTVLRPGNRVTEDRTSVLKLTKNGKTIAQLDLRAEFKKWVKHNWGGHPFTHKIRNTDELVEELPVVYQALPLPNGKLLAVVGYRQYDLDLGPKRADLVRLNLKPFKMTYLRSLGWASYWFSNLEELKPRLNRCGNSNLILIESGLFVLKSDGSLGSLVMSKEDDDVFGIVNDRWLITETASSDLKSALLQATNLQNKEVRTLFEASKTIEIELVPIQWVPQATMSPYFCLTLDYNMINMKNGHKADLHPKFFAVNPATNNRTRLPESVLCAGNYGIGVTALTGNTKKDLPIYDLRSGRLVQVVPWH